jgi:hypothetical protein
MKLTRLLIGPVVDSTAVGRRLSRWFLGYRCVGLCCDVYYSVLERSRWERFEGPNEREMGNVSEFDTGYSGSALTRRVSVIADVVIGKSAMNTS